MSKKVRMSLFAAIITLTLVLPLLSSNNHADATLVSVRVEGRDQTLLPETWVFTLPINVVKDGNPAHACSGFSSAGALELATTSNWMGKWFSGYGYFVTTILGEEHIGEEDWSFWINYRESTDGICSEMPADSSEILFFPTGGLLELPLELKMPDRVEANLPFFVTVYSHHSSGNAQPEPGVTITTSAGNSTTTDSNGTAMLILTNPGEVTVQAKKQQFVRTEGQIEVTSN